MGNGCAPELASTGMRHQTALWDVQVVYTTGMQRALAGTHTAVALMRACALHLADAEALC